VVHGAHTGVITVVIVTLLEGAASR
jgi:hypothetical protein